MTRPLLAALVAAVAAVVTLSAPSAAALPEIVDCKGALEPSVVGGCDGVTLTGCCDATGRAVWCEGANLYCLDCAQGFDFCGWNPLGYYDCGQALGSEDPTGTHPRACSDCGAGCDEAGSCGPGCPGECGSCAEAGEVCLEDGSCWAPQCDGKACGVDPQGISCGTCPAGTECVDGLFQCMPLPEGCLAQPTGVTGCGGCACEACVCAKYPGCCSEGWDVFCAAACELECGQDCSACPAEPSCDGIGCGSYCGVDCGGCEAGQVCHGYQCCAPQCDGKTCGSDGCGGVCGTCEGADACVDGVCVACQPQCDGKACGDDGCGGSCGTCESGTMCSAGQCVAGGCAGKCGGSSSGPWGQCWCDNQCVNMGDCCADACEVCDLKACCTPACDGKACGDDGCGGSCGQCADGETCEAGQCLPCQPQCDGKACGPDGCGGSCGTCAAGEACAGGVCEACEPQCDGKGCGDDGCGGSCGTCAIGQVCAAGVCTADPCFHISFEGCCEEGQLKYCQNGQLVEELCNNGCGWNGAAGYYDCGQSGADPSGQWPLECPGQGCTPSCDGLECGSDGCGGSCGGCGAGSTCQAGQCVSDVGPEPVEAVEVVEVVEAVEGAEVVEIEAVEAVEAVEEAAEVEVGPEPMPEPMPEAADDVGGDVAGSDAGDAVGSADAETESPELVSTPGVGGEGCGGCQGGAGHGWLPLAMALVALLGRRRRA